MERKVLWKLHRKKKDNLFLKRKNRREKNSAKKKVSTKKELSARGKGEGGRGPPGRKPPLFLRESPVKKNTFNLVNPF